MKVQISQRAWHYRYLVWLQTAAPDNLCAYFWKVVACTTVLPLALLVMFPAIVVVVGSRVATDWFIDRRCGRTRPPSLVAAWLRAKKAKVCPLLEWTE